MSEPNSSKSSGQTLAGRYADSLLIWRFPAMILALVAVGFLASGAQHLKFGANYRLFFSDENPELLAFEDFQEVYTKNDNILFVIQPANPTEGAVFQKDLTGAIEKLTKKAWTLPFAIRVDSITNFQHTWSNEDDLTVEDLISESENLSEADFAKKKAIALAEPLLRGNVISTDADTTGVNVTLQFPEEDITEVPMAANAAREMAAELKAEYPDLTIALTGVSMLNASFGEASQRDMPLLGGMFLVILVISAIWLRTIVGTIVTAFVMLLSLMAGMGFGGWSGYLLTPISMTAPIIIITLAVADSIHILVSMRKAQAMGMNKIEALQESMRINLVPVTITSITTIIGFLALNFSDTPPFWHLGNMTAAGIATAWLLSMTLLPALVSLLPSSKAPANMQIKSTGLVDRYAVFLIGNRNMILVIGSVIALGFAALTPTLELNDEWVKYFDEDIQFRQDAQFGMEHLTGIYLIEFSVEQNIKVKDQDGNEIWELDEEGISGPEYLNNLEKFTAWLRSQPEVEHVYSFSDIIKRLSKNLNGDQDEFYLIPQNRQLAAQYTLLYEMSLPFGLDLQDRVAIDKSSTRVTATLPEISTVKVREFLTRSQNWFDENTPESITTVPTGPTVMFAFVAQRNIHQMLTGNVWAIGLISIVMMIALRSFGLGALSLIPNSVPILITFGIWALLVGVVGMAAATVTSTSLGIVVDDTVHFLAKYLYARREKGLSKPEAIRYSFNTVGSALIVTTIVLAIGFSVLAFSSFRINYEMGMLTAIAILVAFIFDFTVLPALLLLGYKPKTQPETTSPDEKSIVPAAA